MQHFEKLYMANIEEVSKKVENSFLFCGKNWDFYFTKKDNKTDFEELENVKYMEFVRINSYDDLQDGYMGIKEPVSDDYEIPQDGLLVMPGLAFDVTLNRIGYGGGFYDRYLVKNGDRYYKTAICFDYQVLDDIPAEEFDIRPDMIITDKRIITAQEL